MIIRKVLRFVVALVALLFSSSSFAATYFTGNNVSGFFSSLQAASDAQCSSSPNVAYCVPGSEFRTRAGGYTDYEQCTFVISSQALTCRRAPASSDWLSRVDVSSCPASLPYEWSDGVCYDEPEQATCEVDQLIEGIGYPSSSGSGSASIDYDGCEAVSVGVGICRVDTDEPGGWRCVGDIRLTGNSSPPEIPEVFESPDISTDPLNDVSGSESSDTDVSPTVTQPDGTQIDVTTVTDTAIAASGVSISESPSTITVVESDGVTTETETAVTVTVNPDGSYSERTDTTVTITNPGGSRTRITKSDGSTTIENIPSGSRTDTSARVDYFDADGRKIGSSGSSGSSGDGPITVPGIGSGDGGGGGQGGEGDGLGSFCDWADIVCQLADWLFDEPLYPENPEVPFTDIDLSDIDDFDSGIGAGQCPADNVISTRFGAVPISWALPCELATTFRPVVLFFAWITALYIVVRVK